MKTRKNNKEIIEAKVNLYLLLLETSTNNFTNNEVELLYLLSNDEHVQEFLDKKPNL